MVFVLVALRGNLAGTILVVWHRNGGRGRVRCTTAPPTLERLIPDYLICDCRGYALMRRRKKRIVDGYGRAGAGDMSAKDVRAAPDPREAALAISLVCMLCEAMEGAGAVRDLVHQHITEDRHASEMTQELFEAAMDQVPHAPQDVREAFLDAFGAAWAMPVPGTERTREIIPEALDTSTKLIGRIGICQAAAEAFAGAFPGGAQTAIRTRDRPPYDNPIKFPHTRNAFLMQKTRQVHWRSQPDITMLSQIFQKTHRACMSGTDTGKTEGDAFRQACSAAIFRMAEQATKPDPTYALCMAAAAVMLPTIDEYGTREYLRRFANRDCDQIARAISHVSGLPLERARIIPDAILEGARTYPADATEAMGEAAVRAVRTAHMWVSLRAATAVFWGIYGLAAGAAWYVSSDRSHFESVCGRTLEIAGKMDPDIQYAFNPLADLSDSEFDQIETSMWDFFYDASGRTMDQWAEVAQGVDYRHEALLPENGPIMEAYGSYYEKSAAAASAAAANEKGSKRQDDAS